MKQYSGLLLVDNKTLQRRQAIQALQGLKKKLQVKQYSGLLQVDNTTSQRKQAIQAHTHTHIMYTITRPRLAYPLRGRGYLIEYQ